jgi:hypothetical protein
MMKGAPLKFRIMELVDDEGPLWTQEIVDKISAEYNMTSEYERAMINYDVVEMVSAGFLKEGDCKVDESGVYRQGKLLTQYSITKLGKATVEELKSKFKEVKA